MKEIDDIVLATDPMRLCLRERDKDEYHDSTGNMSDAFLRVITCLRSTIYSNVSKVLMDFRSYQDASVETYNMAGIRRSQSMTIL